MHFYPLPENVAINGDTTENKTPEALKSSDNNIIGLCPDCGHVMDAAAVEKYRETFEMVDTKINANSSTGIAMGLAEFCFKQMAKVGSWLVYLVKSEPLDRPLAPYYLGIDTSNYRVMQKSTC